MGRGNPGVGLRTLVMVVALLGLIVASEIGGRVEGSKVKQRSLVYGPQMTMWKRTRRMPDQETMFMNFLLSGEDTSIKHPSQSRKWSNNDKNSFLFGGEEDQPNDESNTGSQLRKSDLQDERRKSVAFRNTPHQRIQTFLDIPQVSWNLGKSRRHRPLAGRVNPELSPSYLALDETPFSSFRDQGERQLLSFGARKILVEPEEKEAWRRPTQKFWRRLRSLNNIPQSDDNYLLSSKRQPPPGFHAIRGKRKSEEEEEEGDEEGQEEQEEEEEAGQEADLNLWRMRHVTEGRIRKEEMF